MATVVDVAAYILKRCGAMTTMKFTKARVLFAGGIFGSSWTSSF